MTEYSLPFFGALNIDNLELYYGVYTDVKGTEIKIDLNFEDSSIDIKRLEIVKEIIVNINEYNDKNKKYIEQDFGREPNGTISTYIRHHLSELDEKELSSIVDVNLDRTVQETQMMNYLHLIRVGFYPSEDKQFAIFDYTIGKDLTQYVIAIVINRDRKLDDIVMES